MRPVHLLLRARRGPGVDVNAAVHWEPRCVVNCRNGSPEGDSAEVLVQIQVEDVFGRRGSSSAARHLVAGFPYFAVASALWTLHQ